MHGWKGDYAGFRVTAAEQVTLDGSSNHKKHAVLSSKDVAMRVFCPLTTTFAVTVNQRLDQDRFLQAAGLVLISYPALGSRLRLQPLPVSLDLTKPSFPVSFAIWPQGSAARFQYDYQWEESSAPLESHIPDPPFAHAIEPENAVNGQDALFTLRVTSLGDGATVIAANWLHVLLDGQRAADVLNAIAGVYRGLSNGSQIVKSPYLPSCDVERRSWPWDVEKLPMKSEAAPPVASSRQELDKDVVLHRQDGLLDGPACLAKSNFRSLFGPLAIQRDEWDEGWRGTLIVRLHKEDIKSLKAALQSHPLLTGVPFSTNDVVLALTWLITCDSRGFSRPGQGPAGSTRGAAVVVDASVPWPELAPPGMLGNLILTNPVYAASDGSAQADPDSIQSLHAALARAVSSIRSLLQQVRYPANLRETMCTHFEELLSSQAWVGLTEGVRAGGMDGLLSNWNQAGHENWDFGSGPSVCLLGHFGLQLSNLIGIVALDNTALGISLPVHSRSALQRLQKSPVFTLLAPKSGLLGDFNP